MQHNTLNTSHIRWMDENQDDLISLIYVIRFIYMYTVWKKKTASCIAFFLKRNSTKTAVLNVKGHG